MPKSDRSIDIQFGALPYRVGQKGLEILLITSRGTGRWVIPKGWPMVGKKAHKVAEIEARQEAGVKGLIGKQSIGSYFQMKEFSGGEERLCTIEVYPLKVVEETTDWREKDERQRTWFLLREAAELVSEGALAQIIEEWGRV